MIEIGNTIIYDIREIAAEFNVTYSTIGRYIREGRIKGQKVGTKWYISEEAIADFFRQPYVKSKNGKSGMIST